MNYEYDDQAASHADDFLNRADEPGAFVGEIKRADAVETEKGTKGIYFEVEAPGGNTGFTLYTEKEDGERIFGFNKVQALMTVLGMRSLRAAAGKVSVYDADEKKRVEVDGEVFPDLIGKKVGFILEKELYTNQSGKDSYRMNLHSWFHPETKLFASEIRERKVKPEKIEKALKQVAKVRDNRVKKAAEPDQPSVAPAGDY